MASFLFPRTIAITRPVAPSSIGLNPYQGLAETEETTIATGVACNIDIASSGRNTSTSGLEGDSPGPIKFTITIGPSSLTSLPTINERDVIYDDLGRRFQVAAFQSSAIGIRLDTVRVTA